MTVEPVPSAFGCCLGLGGCRCPGSLLPELTPTLGIAWSHYQVQKYRMESDGQAHCIQGCMWYHKESGMLWLLVSHVQTGAHCNTDLALLPGTGAQW